MIEMINLASLQLTRMNFANGGGRRIRSRAMVPASLGEISGDMDCRKHRRIIIISPSSLR